MTAQSAYLNNRPRELREVAPDADLSLSAYCGMMERRYDRLPDWWWNPIERDAAWRAWRDGHYARQIIASLVTP